MRTFDSEFNAGKKSAIETGIEEPLAQDNLRKMKMGIKSDILLIRAYWAGYMLGIIELYEGCNNENFR